MHKLTEQAAQRFADMGDAVEEAQGLVLTIQRRIGEIERGKNPSTQAEEIDVFQQELDRQQRRLQPAQQTFVDLSRVHAAVRTWLSTLNAGVTLEDAEEITFIETAATEDHVGAVTRIRTDIEDLARSRSAVTRALPPIDELWRQVDAHVDALAERGRPSMTISDRLAVSHVLAGSDPVAAQMAWLFRDQMRERLRSDAEAMHEQQTRAGRLVKTSAERSQQLRSLDEAILAKERAEEWLISDAAALGTAIPRRERCSPLAILGLRVASRPRVKAA